eukprot:COSAG01_NODE_2219_length_8143_cov_100.563083_7_plen_70_part_00
MPLRPPRFRAQRADARLLCGQIARTSSSPPSARAPERRAHDDDELAPVSRALQQAANELRMRGLIFFAG